MTVPKPMLTESGVHHRLESCVTILFLSEGRKKNNLIRSFTECVEVSFTDVPSRQDKVVVFLEQEKNDSALVARPGQVNHGLSIPGTSSGVVNGLVDKRGPGTAFVPRLGENGGSP